MTRIAMNKTHKLAFAAVLGMEGYSRSHLPKRLYELVKLRASELNQCQHCITMHTKALRELGESDERLAALAQPQLPGSVFDEAELAALELTDVLTHIDPEVGVSDEVWQRASAHFDDNTLGNLVMGICTINVWNRVNIAIRLDA